MSTKKLVVFIIAICMAFTLASCGGKKNSTESIVVNSPADLEGLVVAVQSDTTSAYALERLIEEEGMKFEVSKYDKVMLCFDDLHLGRVDAVFVDSVVMNYYTAGSDKYRLAWLDSEGEPMGMCLARSSADLATAIEAAIDTMFFDGSMGEIAKKHFGNDFTAGLRDVKSKPVIPADFTTLHKGQLYVGAEMAYPPMEYMTDDGLEYQGFDIDVANRLGELLGLEVIFVDTAWEGIFAGVEKGEYDVIISSVSITPERQAKYILTEPYVSNQLCIVVRAE